jgi:hypothetical protein
MVNVTLDLRGYRFEANNQIFEIEAGHLITQHLENGNVQWDWQISMKLRKIDFIPQHKPTALLYSDNRVFVRTKVIGRKKARGLSTFTLVPWIDE